ncbi:putative transcriptional regulator [Crossiella equi]|uniref:Transcriptional regulator n=1 Tax=Crossiella equi TaxID=130796 RepID=A0ABS5AGE0_9PSEU|nr:putative transcriptional regulator [Crossiella equi]
MRTSLTNVHYSIRETAWMLGVAPSAVSRAVRLGMVQAVWRRGRLVVPAKVLVRLLGQPLSGGTP